MALYAAGGDIKRRGTNPSELIAAAHAGSFSMPLAYELGELDLRALIDVRDGTGTLLRTTAGRIIFNEGTP